MEVFYDVVMILWRLVLAFTILPFGIEEWRDFLERR